MGSVPVGVFRIAPVTRLACYFSVDGLHESRVDINLFERFQRSQRPRSTFTGRLRQFAKLWPDLFDLRTQADYSVQVGMAGDTFTLGFGRFGLRIRGGETKEGRNNKDNYQAGSIVFLLQQAFHGKVESWGKAPKF